MQFHSVGSLIVSRSPVIYGLSGLLMSNFEKMINPRYKFTCFGKWGRVIIDETLLLTITSWGVLVNFPNPMIPTQLMEKGWSNPNIACMGK